MHDGSFQTASGVSLCHTALFCSTSKHAIHAIRRSSWFAHHADMHVSDWFSTRQLFAAKWALNPQGLTIELASTAFQHIAVMTPLMKESAAAAGKLDTRGPHVQNVICRKILDLVPAVDFERNFCTLGVVARFAP